MQTSRYKDKVRWMDKIKPSTESNGYFRYTLIIGVVLLAIIVLIEIFK